MFLGEMMGKVLFLISEELFIDVNMPEDTKIQFIGTRKQFDYVLIELLVVHDDIPGKSIHETSPIVEVVEYCKRCYKPLKLEWD
jgi:hypothetical protein